jgi:NAD(P)-dependent dehydrogenase (short-subunit alcohol dehydrogenase family)
VINYNSSEREASNTADEIKKKGGEVLTLKADVSKAEEVKKMIRTIVEKFGRIDVLVNNAGILLPAAFLDSTEEVWNRTLDVNLKGAYLCSKEVAPIMLNQGRGKIVNISSNSGLAHKTAVGNTPYTVSKAGLIGLTRSMAVNLAPKINVNAICPGWIDTDMTAQEEEVDPHRKNIIIEESLLKRIGRPEEIASAALFLASDDSDFVTGESVTVSGGRPIR